MPNPTKKAPKRVGPFEAATPPDMGDDEKAARTSRRGIGTNMTPTPEAERRMREQLEDAQMMEGMGRAAREAPARSMGTFNPTKRYAKGGSVSSASKRADGCATKGKTKGRFI